MKGCLTEVSISIKGININYIQETCLNYSDNSKSTFKELVNMNKIKYPEMR
jgi:hypothetical protein